MNTEALKPLYGYNLDFSNVKTPEDAIRKIKELTLMNKQLKSLNN